MIRDNQLTKGFFNNTHGYILYATILFPHKVLRILKDN